MLIVEDDDDTRAMYGWCLKAAGWSVEAVANGADALTAAPAFEPDVIVMDVHVPLVDGLTATRRLKRDEDTKHVPIVAVSGGRATEAEAREAGCDAFLAKPCEPEALREVLEKLIAQRDGGAAPA